MTQGRVRYWQQCNDEILSVIQATRRGTFAKYEIKKNDGKLGMRESAIAEQKNSKWKILIYKKNRLSQDCFVFKPLGF